MGSSGGPERQRRTTVASQPAGTDPAVARSGAATEPRTRCSVETATQGGRDSGRVVAPGGVRRALVGFGVGLLAGALVALVSPRDGWRASR